MVARSTVTGQLLLGVARTCLLRNMSTKIQFNGKHLKNGDPLPPYTGKLRVYNMRYCPYAQRTILALNAKQVDYEVVNVNLMDKPDWLFVKSSFGKVPSLEIRDNVTIYESLVTVEYIDEVYPQRPLLSKDPETRAYDKIIVEAITPVHSLLIKLLRDPDSITDDHVTAYIKSLTFVQGQLQKRGTTFLGGSLPGYADYMIWPWLERMIYFAEYDKRIEIDTQKFQLLTKYIENMLKDPAVSQYLIPKEIMTAFYAGYKTQNIDYNIVVDPTNKM